LSGTNNAGEGAEMTTALATEEKLSNAGESEVKPKREEVEMTS
jgi:hypothetical protein